MALITSECVPVKVLEERCGLGLCGFASCRRPLPPAAGRPGTLGLDVANRCGPCSAWTFAQPKRLDLWVGWTGLAISLVPRSGWTLPTHRRENKDIHLLVDLIQSTW